MKNILRPLLFFLVFFGFLWWLWPINMVNKLGDPADIWKAIMSYYTDAPITSYVMYKGILSVFPYVWFYNLARFLNVDDLFFVKIFYSLMFSYVSVIGMPFIWEKVTNKRASKLSSLIFVFSLFMFWKSNYALDNLTIDLPNLTALILAISLAIKIAETNLNNIFYSLLGGLSMGLLLCGSGQYRLSFYALIVFIAFSFINRIKKTKITGTQMLSVFVMSIGIVSLVSLDSQFIKKTIDLADKNQAWFLTREEWLDLSLSGRNMLLMKYGGGPTLDNTRLLAIGQSINSNFTSQVSQGGQAYKPSYFFKLIVLHPMEFAVQGVNKLFLAVSLDNGNRSVIHLLYFYTLLFISLKAFFGKMVKIKDLITTKSLIMMAFILPSLTMLIFHVEMRYFLSLQILIVSSVVLNLDLIKIMTYLKTKLMSLVKKRTLSASSILNMKLNYGFFFYMMFIIICFSWYAAIYERLGITSEIFFQIF